LINSVFPQHNGNALFLILIGVALFAALSYAITQSGRGGGSAAREQESLTASRIVSYGGQIQQAVTRMKLANGCADTQLSQVGLQGTNWLGENPSAPTDKSCHIFQPAGGGVPATRFPAEAFTIPTSANWTGSGTYSAWPIGYGAINGCNSITGWGTTGGTAGVDLVYELFPISLNTCVSINRGLNFNPPTFAPPTRSFYQCSSFNGTYMDGVTGAIIESDKAGGCIYESVYGMYVYVQPIVAR
jgi:hypothetical protein